MAKIGPTQWLYTKSADRKFKVWKFNFLKMVRSLNGGAYTSINQSINHFTSWHLEGWSLLAARAEKNFHLFNLLNLHDQSIRWTLVTLNSPAPPPTLLETANFIFQMKIVWTNHMQQSGLSPSGNVIKLFSCFLCQKSLSAATKNKETKTTVQMRNRKDERKAAACQQSREIRRMDVHCNIA